ncbi:hypothetical protein D1007_61790 [Hordeum vulgare]|nr:hypothetical protein D1007_61790 [Hordeum vulgare]
MMLRPSALPLPSSQYRHDLKKLLEVEKEIVAACMDDAMMAAMRADPKILEKHPAIKATVAASRTDTASWLAALNNSSWCFIKDSAGVFDEDYKLFCQHAHALHSSRSDRLVTEQAQSTHRYEEGTHDVEASPSSKPIIIDISNDEE